MSFGATDAAALLGTTIRFATPLLLAALGGLCSERTGIVALGLEGMMIAGAFAAGTLAAVTGSAWAGVAGAIAAGAAVALVHGWVSISRGGGQVVSGMALNLLMGGLCPALALGWFGIGGETPALSPEARLLPFVAGIGIMPLLATLAVPMISLLLRRTRFGLHLRVAGENAPALHAAGVSVARLRYAGVALCGLLTGLAGADLALADGTGFTRDLTAGRGYIALAALIFGRWQPRRTALACLLFAGADALQIRFQGASLPVIGAVPVALVQAFPALLTVFVLALTAGRDATPGALGKPFPEAG